MMDANRLNKHKNTQTNKVSKERGRESQFSWESKLRGHLIMTTSGVVIVATAKDKNPLMITARTMAPPPTKQTIFILQLMNTKNNRVCCRNFVLFGTESR